MNIFMDAFFDWLNHFEFLLWSVLGFPLILLSGIYFTIRSRGFQFRSIPQVVKRIKDLGNSSHETKGLHPLRVFFAAIGGSVGIGNLVGICSAVKIGGPGAVFWVWVVALLGITLKYSEVYLGMLFRIPTKDGWNGGPMYYLKAAFKSPFFPAAAAVLLCIYGIEIYQFNVVVESITHNWNLDPVYVVLSLLALVVMAVLGEIKLVSMLCSFIIPVFIVMYFAMSSFVLYKNHHELLGVFKAVFSSAFSGHAAVGGFLGSSFALTVSQGIARGCYASDIGIGYASILHSESSESVPQRQASLTFLNVLIDVFGVCTLSMLTVLATSAWSMDIPTSQMVQVALGQYFPYMHVFMPFFLLLLGYSTVIAFFCVGIRAAQYLSPTWGKSAYMIFGICALWVFSWISPQLALSIMQICGGLLLILNLSAFFILRDKIYFD